MQPQYKSGLALLCIKSYYKGIDQRKTKQSKTIIVILPAEDQRINGTE